MISFFPEPYKDEILYSLIARYHIQNKNKNLKDTVREIFGTENAIATIEFPARFNHLENTLPKELGFSSEYFINNHTIYPVYAPFLPDDRKAEIEQAMKYRDGKGIKTKIGMIAGAICRKNALMYCPICAQKEIDTYKEAYFHRLHQVEGVLVCPEHECFLKSYSIKTNDVSRVKYIMFSPDENDLKDVDYLVDSKLLKLVAVANGVKYLLENNLSNFNIGKLHERYMELLHNKGMLTQKGRIRQMEIYQEFVSIYPAEMLDKLNSCIDFSNEYNWLKVALRSPKRVTHPIRNILIIIFLCGDLKSFFEVEFDKHDKQQFFPCLNPVCKNYKSLVIRRYSSSVDSKTGKEIGTFSCKCGFTYSRKMEGDIYKIGRIKEYGATWESKLQELIKSDSYSIRGIANTLRCDSKTVVKYADKLGIKQILNTNMRVTYKEVNEKSTKFDLYQYRRDIENLINENPTIIRSQIRATLSKQYIWLYKNDKEWFDDNMPKMHHSNGNNNNMQVIWEERDNKILGLLISEYDMLRKINNNERITQSLLGRRIGMLATLEKNLDKLPTTKKYLTEIVESVEGFQTRRVNNVCLELFKKGKVLKKWRIVRQSGLKANYSLRVDKQIDNNILKYNNINNVV